MHDGTIPLVTSQWPNGDCGIHSRSLGLTHGDMVSGGGGGQGFGVGEGSQGQASQGQASMQKKSKSFGRSTMIESHQSLLSRSICPCSNLMTNSVIDGLSQNITGTTVLLVHFCAD